MNKVIEVQGKADVPVGVFLSGGLDSSLISSIMQSQSDIPINTFTQNKNIKYLFIYLLCLSKNK